MADKKIQDNPTENMVEPVKGKRDFTSALRENPWILSTLVLGIIILILLVGNFSPTGNAVAGSAVSESDAGQAVLELAQAQVPDAELVSVEKESGLYKITLSMQGREVPVYLTLDGENLINGGLIPLATLEGQEPSDTPDTPSEPAVQEISIDDDAIKGDPNAPVTIVEFSDYECPFCKRHFEQTVPQIVSEYVDKGLVKMVFRDFPLGFHDKAQKAGEAAECAGEQGRYWDMHDKLFENNANLDVEDLKKYAEDLGLNTAKFNTCLDSDAMAQEIKDDMAEGQSYGVTGTPASFINGRFVSGARPFSDFKKIIDEELAKAEAA